MNAVAQTPRRASRWAPLLAVLLAGCGAGGIGDMLGTTPKNPPAARQTPPPPTEQESSFALEVFNLVNQERMNRSLPPVLWDAAAADAAFDHANDMDVRAFFDHTNPDGEGPGARLTRHGVIWFGYGENIAQGQSTPTAVMSAWMNSTEHRDNILNPTLLRLGVGVRIDSDGPWWVEDFAD